MTKFQKNNQYLKFCLYGFLKNLRFFDAFFILFLIAKGLPYTQIGILYAIREILTNIFEIPSGIVADTYGRKKALAGSFIAYIFSFLIFTIANGFWLFALAFILYGIGDAFRSGTHKGMIMDYLKLNNWADQKINYYGHTRSWSQKGSAVSALVAGFIVYFGGSYENIFLYSIVPYVLNFMLILSYPKELNHSSKKSKEKPSLKQTMKTLIRVIRQPNVLSITNTTAVHSAYLKAVKDYIQPIMVQVAIALPILMTVDKERKEGLIIGLLYFGIYLSTSYASRKSVHFVKRGGRSIAHQTLLIGFVLGIGIGAFYIFNWWILALLSFVGIYLVENLRKPILTGFISDNVPNEILTSVISVQSLLKTIITAVLAFSFGLLADYFGVGIAFLFVSLVLVFGSLMLKKSPTRKLNIEENKRFG